MRTVHFDSLGGASGDMILAALLGLGADRDELARLLSSLDIGPFEIECTDVREHALAGLRVTVKVPAPHEHTPHRRLRDIRDLLAASSLPQAAKDQATAVFERLAAAEAAVHGVDISEVHFHEVGAVDSIVDIAGACTALHLLGVQRVTAGPLPLGSGWVDTAHGRLPVPAPATVELLKGFPVAECDEPFELVTPTAAALLTTWTQSGVSGPDARPAAGPGRLLAASCAFGHRTLRHRPNILRARLCEVADNAQPGADECLVLECNVDDTVPELLGSLVPRLLQAGALDAFTAPVYMKKQRPACLLTVLCEACRREDLLDLLFAETTTFGVREYTARRVTLFRRRVEVATPYGTVRVKVGTWKGRDVTRSPEHDDCARLAEARGVPVRTVYEAALRAS
jgi:uncharacterized protein (TIGR00299 family) protein